MKNKTKKDFFFESIAAVKENKKCTAFLVLTIYVHISIRLNRRKLILTVVKKLCQNDSFITHVSFPVQDLIGIKIQYFLYRSWADLYNFPVQRSV